MKIKSLGLVIALLIARWGIASAEQTSPYNLTIRLPREATVSTETLTLGQIAAITGDEELAAQAGEIELGRMSVPGQKMTIDRSLIRSRLACSGINAGEPALVGADKVTVRQLVKVIKGDSFVESASSFLAENITEQSIAGWEPVRAPAELILSNQPRDIELRPGLVSRGVNGSTGLTAGGQTIVEVSVVADGVVSGTRQVVFRPKYNVRRAVTVSEVKAGEALTTNNTRIDSIVADEAQPVDWTPPYGLIAVHNLAAGTEISPGTVKAPKAQVIIERNQTVVIRIDKLGLVVTAMGKAMQQGKLDEYIKVRNTDSQRVVLARVNEDGTVEPVF